MVTLQSVLPYRSGTVWTKIKAWRANPEYIEARKIGEKYAKFHSFAIEGQ
jgi:hypothetical protein